MIGKGERPIQRMNDHNNSYSFHPLLFVVVLLLNRQNYRFGLFLFHRLHLLVLGVLTQTIPTFYRVFSSLGVAYRLVIIFAYLKYSS